MYRKIISISVFLVLILPTRVNAAEKQPLVDFTDGINDEEAIYMAVHEIIQSSDKNYFGDIVPRFIENDATKKYPEWWFLEFTPDVFVDYTSYLVVIEKKSGKILHSQKYFDPLFNNNFETILNAIKSHPLSK
ncbi:MAG: hypothetical protein KC713_08405 [Candidatus Omnitrophica bacterium]|nr:hypothetical protein [Candidatus Omnitrophota bacterium]